MAEKLSEQEIQKRLMKLRNYERIYPELREKYEKEKLRAKAKEKEQQDQINLLKDQLEIALLRIEELERMVFGDGSKGGRESNSFPPPKPEPKPKKQRSKEAKHRPQQFPKI